MKHRHHQSTFKLWTKAVSLVISVSFVHGQILWASPEVPPALRPVALEESSDPDDGMSRRNFFKTSIAAAVAAWVSSTGVAQSQAPPAAKGIAASRAQRAKEVGNIREQQARIFNNYGLTSRIAYNQLDTSYHRRQVKKRYEHELTSEGAAIESEEGMRVAQAQKKMLAALGDYLKAADEATRNHQFADVNGSIQSYFDAEIAYLGRIEEYNKKQQENSHRLFRKGGKSLQSHESVGDICAISAARRAQMEQWRQIYSDLAILGAPLPSFHIIPVDNFKGGVWNAISQLVNPNPLTDPEERRSAFERIRAATKKILELECDTISCSVRIKQRYVEWLQDNLKLKKKFVSEKQLNREKRLLAAQESTAIVKIGFLCAQINQIEGGKGLFDMLNFAVFKHMDILVEKARVAGALSDEDAQWAHSMFRKGFVSESGAAAAKQNAVYHAAAQRISEITRALADQYSAMGLAVPAQTTKAPAVLNPSSVHAHLPAGNRLLRSETAQETQARAQATENNRNYANDKVIVIGSLENYPPSPLAPSSVTGLALEGSPLGVTASGISVAQRHEETMRAAMTSETHDMLGRGFTDFQQFVTAAPTPIPQSLSPQEVKTRSDNNRKLNKDQLDQLVRMYSITEASIRLAAEWTLQRKEYFTSEEEREDMRNQLRLARVMRLRAKLLETEKDIIELKEGTPEYAHARKDYDGTVMSILEAEHSRLIKRLEALKKRRDATHKLFRSFVGNEADLMYRDADVEECLAASNQLDAQIEWFQSLRRLGLPLGSPDFSPSSMMPIKILQQLAEKGANHAKFHGNIRKVEKDGKESLVGIASVSRTLPLGNVVYISGRRFGEGTRYERQPKGGFLPRSRIVKVGCDLLALLPGTHPDSIGTAYVETESVIPRLQMESGMYRIAKVGDFYGVDENQQPELLGRDPKNPDLDVVAQPAYDVVAINGEDHLVQIGVYVRRAKRPQGGASGYTFEPDKDLALKGREPTYGTFRGDGDTIDLGPGKKLTARVVKGRNPDGTPRWSVQYEGIIREPEKMERRKAPRFKRLQKQAAVDIEAQKAIVDLERELRRDIEAELRSIAEVYNGLDIRFSYEFGTSEVFGILKSIRKGLDMVDRIDGGLIRNATSLPTRHIHISLNQDGSVRVKIDGVREGPPINIPSDADIQSCLWREIVVSYLGVSRLPKAEQSVWDQLLLPEPDDRDAQFRRALRVYLELEPFSATEENKAEQLRQCAYVRSLLKTGLKGLPERRALLDEQAWDKFKISLAAVGIVAGEVALELLTKRLLTEANRVVEQEPRPRTQDVELELGFQKSSLKSL